MTLDHHEIVTVELDCPGWLVPVTRDITRHQLGELLLKLDDMAADTYEAAPGFAQTWPTPDEAYADAPSIDEELDWLNRTAAEAGWEEELCREYYLRKAAAFDRIALCEDGCATDTDVAEGTAAYLLDLDQAPGGYDPRAYVRQQYAMWASREHI
ncbi:hypothetical protein [Streptomyces sp. NPDC059008]|uniref:hypothetical protein n=1 Tax=Streptomyces sp. NPDC059008 TaxID=3346693 RepID=UPI0036B95EC1